MNWNFGARLVDRLGLSSQIIDAATGRAVSSEDLPKLIASYAGALLSAGLEKGDRVLIGCSLSPSCVLAYIGVIFAGLVAVPVDDRMLASSLTVFLENTGAKAVWTETELRGSDTAVGSTLFLHGDLAVQGHNAPPVPCEGNDVAVLMGTSGSTGIPRFVRITHRNLIANTEAIVLSQRLRNDERAMLILPLNYCFGASVLHTHLYQGGSIVLDRRFMFPDRVLQAVAQFDCTTFAGVPTVYNVLLRRSSIRQMSLPSLRRFLQAGGSLTVERVNEMRSLFPQTDFFVMYGQTEATARISCLEPKRWDEKSGSVGRPLPDLEVAIEDEEGNRLPPGHLGELLVKGPSISPGYWNDPEETNRVFRDGWLRTRDLARQDAEGFLWIEGRLAGFLKMRGTRVSFAEVEQRVVTIPGVYDCAAVAVDHPEAGEALALFVVPDPGVAIAAEEVRRRLPAHWTLDSVHLVSQLPMTATGKVARSVLAARGRELHASV